MKVRYGSIDRTMKVVCVVRTEGMRGYTLGETYDFLVEEDWRNGGDITKNDNGKKEFWSLFDINRYFKPLRDYSLQTLVNDGK